MGLFAYGLMGLFAYGLMGLWAYWLIGLFAYGLICLWVYLLIGLWAYWLMVVDVLIAAFLVVDIMHGESAKADDSIDGVDQVVGAILSIVSNVLLGPFAFLFSVRQCKCISSILCCDFSKSAVV